MFAEFKAFLLLTLVCTTKIKPTSTFLSIKSDHRLFRKSDILQTAFGKRLVPSGSVYRL